MELQVMGNCGPFPKPGAATSGYVIQHDQTRIALDMGTGVLSNLTRVMAPEDLDAVFLSHWHYDHCSDMLPFLYRLQATGKKMKVYAPVDEGSAVRQILMRESVIELTDIAPGDMLEIGKIRVKIFKARHPVPAVMFRCEETTSGKVIAYTGDTNTQDELISLAQDADILLADGPFPESVWSENKPHLSAKHCAEIARDASVRLLILTHFSPMIPEEKLLREAQAIFSDTRLSMIGQAYRIETVME